MRLTIVSLAGPALAVVLCACGPVASSAGGIPAMPTGMAEGGESSPPPGASFRLTLEAAGLPTLRPDSARSRVPTRVRMPALAIDLPVIVPPSNPDHYPFCGVAEFLPAMARPGFAGSTFLYAHARPGMFLPILERSRVRDGRSMVGMTVEVFTSDDRRFTYEVTEVRRHVTSLDFAFGATGEQLILQTSEGPHGTPGKTMLIALPREEHQASPGAAAPLAEPVRCP